MWGPPTGGDDDSFSNFPFNNIFREVEEMMRIFDSTGTDMDNPHLSLPKDEQRSLREQILKRPNRQAQEEIDVLLPPPPHSRNPFDFLIEQFMGNSFHQLPVVTPLPKTDIDLDARIAEEGVKSVLENQNKFSTKQPRVYSKGFFRSQSTIRSSDGTIEKRTTERDTEGNETTTVTVERPDGSIESKQYQNEGELDETLYGNNLHDLIIATGKIIELTEDPKDYSSSNSHIFSSPFTIFSSVSSAIYDIFKGKN